MKTLKEALENSSKPTKLSYNQVIELVEPVMAAAVTDPSKSDICVMKGGTESIDITTKRFKFRVVKGTPAKIIFNDDEYICTPADNDDVNKFIDTVYNNRYNLKGTSHIDLSKLNDPKDPVEIVRELARSRGIDPDHDHEGMKQCIHDYSMSLTEEEKMEQMLYAMKKTFMDSLMLPFIDKQASLARLKGLKAELAEYNKNGNILDHPIYKTLPDELRDPKNAYKGLMESIDAIIDILS